MYVHLFISLELHAETRHVEEYAGAATLSARPLLSSQNCEDGNKNITQDILAEKTRKSQDLIQISRV